MYQKISVCCLLILCLFGCKDNGTNVIVNIEDDFTIDLFEDISNGDRNFQLDISTISSQTCLNYTITYDLDFDEQDNAIELTLNDLVEPENCIAGTSITSLNVPFGNISNGSYRFDLNLKDAVINEGQLTVATDHYLLEMNSDDGIEVINSRLNKIPNKTIWGYVGYDDNADATNAADFLNDLANLSSVFPIENNSLYKTGYFGYFRLDEDKKLIFPGEINFNNSEFFIFQHDSDNLQDIRQVMLDACDLNNNLEIQIYTDKGTSMECN